ncbi:SulP family inorganic anion transporter [Halomonas sp. LR5S13]|uniref:SulP family inorganic anion transporter n=1 Tax=Halomonas rhizosphaerae TaxID=3043296 RepID=UPI0024A9F1FE|nr:SulP family inorganic anion transporter [Halomonas rhizosphaerae]MDI5922660.1 SulP family inorganic anion transporter [Halomonas rhizosphaerae]
MRGLSGISLRGPDWLAQITPASLRGDALAGLTGAAIVLPQAVAFASIAGLPPEYGLYTAMIPPIVAAIFGSSLVMVSGPTTAISAVVFSALAGNYTPGSSEFVSAAILLALLVGVIQLAFALARVGRLAGFVSHSVMTGFTAAAALLIFVSQLGPALGLVTEKGHGIVGRLSALVTALPGIDPVAALVAGVTLATAILLRVFLPRSPGFLIAVGLGTVVAMLMGDMAGGLSRVGNLPSAFPAPMLPQIAEGEFPGMLESAFAIALIGLLEAIAIGRNLAHRTRTDFSANREVVGQGLSNIVGSLFQCYPASGSFTRSGVNLEAGARTPIAAIFAALFLITMVVAFRPVIAQVPIAAVAGLILYVAYKLLDFHEVAHLIRTSLTETTIAALTFLVGLLVSLEFAIYIGTFASLAVFLGKSANPVLAIGAPDQSAEPRKIKNAKIFDLPECPAALILRLDGPLFFGSVDSINAKLRQLARRRPEQVNLILILHGVGEVDLAGVGLLELEAERRRALGGDIFVVVHYPQLVAKLKRFGLVRILGEDRIFADKGAAIAAAVTNIRLERCATCYARVFLECRHRPAPPDLEPVSTRKGPDHD